MKDKKPPKKTNKQPNGKDSLPPMDEDTKKLLSGALVSYLKERADGHNSSQKNTLALIATVEEFLNSFIILGYTMDGTPVQYICAHNQQQADSLATLVNKFFQRAILSNDSDDPN